MFQRFGIDVAFAFRMPEDKRLVYVLKSANPKTHYYIGLTSNVLARLADHNAGRCRTPRATALGNST